MSARGTTYHDTTEERYFEMLGALPPVAYGAGGFLVGEPSSHRSCRITGRVSHTYEAYFERDGLYRQADEPMTITEFQAVTAGEVFP